jgi:hypothetical protein
LVLRLAYRWQPQGISVSGCGRERVGHDLRMTEHEMQMALTDKWADEGIALETGEVLRLVAWEVMAPSWMVNDASRRWGEPAADFLATDDANNLVAIELKPRLTAPRTVWRAACQVTHIALALAQSVSASSLRRVRQACLSGVHGRVVRPGQIGDLLFNPDARWRRFVVAPEIDYDEVSLANARLGADPVRAAQDWLNSREQATPADRPVERLAAMPSEAAQRLIGPVLALHIDIPA